MTNRVRSPNRTTCALLYALLAVAILSAVSACTSKTRNVVAETPPTPVATAEVPSISSVPEAPLVEAAPANALAGRAPDVVAETPPATAPSPEAILDDAAAANALASAEPGHKTPSAQPLRNDVEDEDPLSVGRWRRYRTSKFDRTLTAEQRRLMEQLESLGYARGSTPAKARVGVTIHDQERAYRGLNLYSSGHMQGAILMDMDGRVLHRWSCDFWEVWPDYPRARVNNTEYWRRVYLFENGDILVIYEGLGIVKLDKDSNLIWANPNRAHHDLDVMPNGDIFVLTREVRIVPELHKRKPVLEDFISVLDADGNESRRVSLLECCANSTYRHVFLPRPQMSGYIFHTNTLEVLDGRIADRAPAFAKGNVLTSMRPLHAIAVVDLELERVVWARTGGFKSQHDPKILENGNLLLFDNRGRRGQSAVIEFDPATDEIVWQYRGTSEDPFYSRTCGLAERLPNGNTLITESDNGRAFEVTSDKVTVWEFVNPARAGENDEFTATLFELVRLGPDFPVGWAQVKLRD